MRKILAILLLFQITVSTAQEKISSLPVWGNGSRLRNQKDWLIDKIDKKAGVYQSADHKDIIIDNGLL